MDTYHFDYATPSRVKLSQLRRRAALNHARRPVGIVFGDDTGPNAYYYDLRTRYPFTARVKRGLDLLMATTAVTILAPVLVILMVLIKATSRGSIIFRQRRIGFRGNQFDMYKFRTMYDGSHLKEAELAMKAGGSFLKLKNDPRVTPLGRILRKYSLDELPQFFNVLEGTMSMVGPRPLLPSDLEKLPRRSPLRRFAMPPGITGLWQVSGRSNCTEAKRMQYDRQYVDRWTLRLDLEILLRTFEVVLTGRDSV